MDNSSRPDVGFGPIFPERSTKTSPRHADECRGPMPFVVALWLENVH